jgi:hypothetical protein
MHFEINTWCACTLNTICPDGIYGWNWGWRMFHPTISCAATANPPESDWKADPCFWQEARAAGLQMLVLGGHALQPV